MEHHPTRFRGRRASSSATRESAKTPSEMRIESGAGLDETKVRRFLQRRFLQLASMSLEKETIYPVGSGGPRQATSPTRMWLAVVVDVALVVFELCQVLVVHGLSFQSIVM